MSPPPADAPPAVAQGRLRVDLARAQLAAGRLLVAEAEGWSMWPALRPGRRVAVEPCDPASLRVGDVVLAAQGEALVVHRVVRLQARRVLLLGDACRLADGWLPREAVLGRVARRPWDAALGRLTPRVHEVLLRGARVARRLARSPGRTAVF